MTIRHPSSSRKANKYSALLPELAPAAKNRSGCRGIIGPVPPPLWMSRRQSKLPDGTLFNYGCSL